MGVFGAIGGFFKRVGHYVVKAVSAASARGLSDEIIAYAVAYVREYVGSELSNTAKREAVVELLQSHLHIPESIARLAVELAVQVVKGELAKIG